MQESAETVVSRVLEPGEKIVWTGRPNMQVCLDARAQRRGRSRILLLPLTFLLAFWITGSFGFSSPLAGLHNLPFEPRFLWVVAAPALLTLAIRILWLDDHSRMKRYFQSLTYAITDRRLLILEGNQISAAYSPEQVHAPILRQRAPGYSDVNFDEQSVRPNDLRIVQDPVYRERRQVGFKALPNAEEIQQRIALLVKSIEVT